MPTKPYNPLDKLNLAKSIEGELISREPEPLGGELPIVGAGVYAIYYCGTFHLYEPIAASNREGRFHSPIYVGKAIPKGGRKGGLSKDASVGTALAARLKKHANSIEKSSNLALGDFFVRHLVVEDVWIPLGENILIENYKPLWNLAIDGFGNNVPGKRRAGQFASPWDVLHPGRFARSPSPVTEDILARRVEDFVAGRPLAPLPKALRDQQQQIEEDAEEAADDASF